MSFGISVPYECKRSKNLSIYEPFAEAIRSCFTMGKAEKLPLDAYYPLYIGTDLLEQMLLPENQFIWGRRGTGKTHLLKAFTQKVNNENDRNALSFFISCETIKTETPVEITFTDDEQRMKYLARETFINFMKDLIDQIIDTYKDLCYAKSFHSKMTASQKKEFQERVDDVLMTLMDISTYGIPRTIKESEIRKIERAEETGSSMAIGLEPEAKSSIIDTILSWIPFLKGKKEKKSANVISNTAVEKVVYEYRFSKISQNFSALVNALELENIYVCVDELWFIDDKNRISFQPLFLEYLKQTFFGLNNVSLKFASIRETTRHNNKVEMKHNYGLQSGHDFTELADLDTVYLSFADTITRFTDIIGARIEYFMDRTNQADYASGNRVQRRANAHSKMSRDDFILYLFKDNHHFETMIKLSHGIPRNFLNILRVCLNVIEYNLSKNFLHSYLCANVVVATYINDRRADTLMNENSLYVKITKYVLSAKTNFFMITNEHARQAKTEIDNLAYIEIIHRIPSSLTPKNIMNSYKCFLVDSGKYIFSVKDEKEKYPTSAIDTIILKLPPDLEERYTGYLLNLDDMETLFIDCMSCGASFSSKHRVYTEANRCPTCAFVFQSHYRASKKKSTAK